MPNISILTSWPLSMSHGSGTALFANSLNTALNELNQSCQFVSPSNMSHDYKKMLFERLWFNQTITSSTTLNKSDMIIALDYDGFAYKKHSNQTLIVSSRALFADIAITEPEPYKTMLELQAFYESKNMHQADWITTPSEYAKSKLIEYYHLPADKIIVIPNAVNLTEWDDLTENNPVKKSKHPSILVVSKLYPRKRLDIAILALKHLNEIYPDIELKIIGSGFEYEKLNDLAAKAGVNQHVKWLGDINEREKIVEEFQSCHLFIHTSIQETFGNVCLEAMAARKPMVLSNAASMTEIAHASNAALLAKPLDSLDLASKISQILDEHHLAEKLSNNGRKYVEKTRWNEVAQAYLDIPSRLR